jgi:hypothetical protein
MRGKKSDKKIKTELESPLYTLFKKWVKEGGKHENNRQKKI